MKRFALLFTSILLVALALLWFGTNRGGDVFFRETATESEKVGEEIRPRPVTIEKGPDRAKERMGEEIPLSLREVPLIAMPPQARKELLEKARLIDEKRGDGVFRFAEPIDVEISSRTDGKWETLADGSERWRVRISSPGAQSLNFGFSEYEMPEGGRLSIFPPSAEQDRPIRDFTAADNEDHRQLWTPIFESDEVVLEVTLLPDSRELLALKLSRVNHGFRKNTDKAIGNNASGSCNIDVACTTDSTVGMMVQAYANQIRSVGAYTLNGFDTCSGALINNTANDGRPYFLTAEHCGITPGNAPSMVVYFNFENSTCRTPGSPASGQPGNGALTQFNSGAIYRAAYDASDFCLVELDDPVPQSYNVYYAGWDRTGANGMAAGIHHPAVAEKRISFELDDTVDRGATHVEVTDWDFGTTEGGSSGSPLFDAAGRIIGDLTGGLAACGNDGYDEYGRISVSWGGGGTTETRLSDWLDPLNSGSTAIDGINQDDALSIDNVSITEGDSGTQKLHFTVTLTRDSNDTVSVDYETVDGTATSPGDFTSVSDTLTFAPSDTIKTVSITIVGDTDPEENETFEVRLSNPSNAQISDAVGVGIIENDDFIVPEITSSLSASGAEGAPFSYRITALNTPTSYSISSEPAGMTVNGTSGEISWTPPSAGPFSVTIEATNPAGTDSEILNITVSDSQLKQGLDSDRPFTEGTNIWQLETGTTHDGVDSARSPSIKNNQTGYFETEVTAPAGGETVTFWWKVSSEEGFDFLRFLADGALVEEISGEEDWTLVSYSIPAGETETLRWEYVKDASVSEGGDAGYIDELIFASEDLLPVFTSTDAASGIVGEPFFFDVNATNVTSFSSMNLPAGLSLNPMNGEISGTLAGPIGNPVATITATNGNGSRDQDLTITIRPTLESAVDEDEGSANWSTIGDADWFGQIDTTFDGTDAAQAGNISHDEVTTLQATANFDGAQKLSFRWRVSSEADYDFLRFLLNGSSIATPISGETGWQRIQSVMIPAGPAIMRWDYEKDESESHGADTGWVDDVIFTYQLGAVSGLSATGFPSGGIFLDWSSVDDAESYRVYRSNTDDLETATQIASPTDTDYTDLAALPGGHYYYWVRAYSSSTELGATGDSADATAVDVPAPTNVSVSDLQFPDKIRVSWTSATGAESYRIFRHTMDDFLGAAQIAEISSTNTSYDDTTATPSPDSFYYWVAATDTIDMVVEESEPAGSALGRRAADLHGDSPGTATTVPLPTSGSATVTGTLESGDTDFFSFTLTDPQEVRIYTTGNLDTIGTVTDAGSNVRNDPNAEDDAGDDANFLSLVSLEAGQFTVEVGWGPDGDPSGLYTLHIELVPNGPDPALVAEAALRMALQKKIRKLKTKFKRAKRSGKKAAAKRLKKKFKKLRKRLAAI